MCDDKDLKIAFVAENARPMPLTCRGTAFGRAVRAPAPGAAGRDRLKACSQVFLVPDPTEAKATVVRCPSDGHQPTKEEQEVQSGERVFYTGENGDRWLLMSSDEDIASVRHVPNAPSGGKSQTYELGAFLTNERHSAQNQALRALISSLTRVEPSIGTSADNELADRVEAAQKLDRD
jgi:hypothetical protein